MVYESLNEHHSVLKKTWSQRLYTQVRSRVIFTWTSIELDFSDPYAHFLFSIRQIHEVILWDGRFYDIFTDFSVNDSCILMKNIRHINGTDYCECVQFGCSLIENKWSAGPWRRHALQVHHDMICSFASCCSGAYDGAFPLLDTKERCSQVDKHKFLEC